MAAMLVVATAPASAMTEEDALSFLAGEWISYSGDYTWIFDASGEWLQVNGGVETRSTYTVEAMPANLFRLTSAATGSVFVVHAATTGNSFKLFKDNETDSGLAMYRHAPNPSASQPPAVAPQ